GGMGGEDDGARNGVTMLINHLAVACGSQPANRPQFVQQRRRACIPHADPITAMSLPQKQVRSSRTCWPISGDDDNDDVGSKKARFTCSSPLAPGRRLRYTKDLPQPPVQPGVVKAVGLEPTESVACRAWLREPAALSEKTRAPPQSVAFRVLGGGSMLARAFPNLAGLGQAARDVALDRFDGDLAGVPVGE